MKEILKRFCRPMEMYCLLLAYFFSNLFENNFNTENILDTPIKDLLINTKIILHNLFNYQGLIGTYFLLIQLTIVVWIILGKKARLATDLIAIYLTICWFLELICMNLLLVSPISNPLFMLIELVLFIPIILIGFTWGYWRLNHSNRIGMGEAAITFDKPPTYISYFIKTACVAVNDTTEHGVCQNNSAKLLRIANGFVVMDVFGLTLSRAIGLVVS